MAIALLSRTPLATSQDKRPTTGEILRQITHGPYLIHTLVSPVSSLLITIDLCSDTLLHQGDVKRVQDLLGQAKQEVRYLHQILKASRQVKSLNRGRFKVKAALQEVVTRLHQPWLGNFLIAHLAIPDHISVKGQAFFLQEAVSCLIKNAFEAYGQKRHRTVLLICYQHRTSIVVQVSDHGSGMAWKHDQFSLRNQPSPKGAHHGYGLQFVHHVSSDIYRGKLHVHSLKNVGTVITFIIPL